MSSFERHAAERVMRAALAAGIPIPDELGVIVDSLGCSSWAAKRWLEQHPDDLDRPACCDGSAGSGPRACTCWTPVFDRAQAEPRYPFGPGELRPRPRPCSDCAYRAGSPEREQTWIEDALMSLPADGEAFWCHDGMRRPAYWQHPDGRRVEGSADDWQPPQRNGIPFRADGSPGLLCAGWAARAAALRTVPVDG